MPDETVVRYCAPTLTGIKTGNLFSCAFDHPDQADKEVDELDRLLRRKGMRAVSLGWIRTRLLIYLYRPVYLKRDLCNEEAAVILRSYGYTPENLSSSVEHLKERIRNSCGFPHEIGIFLGYPVEDVIGFIENRKCLFTGVWKVYGNPEEAKRSFERYRKCTEALQERVRMGIRLEQLIAAVQI